MSDLIACETCRAALVCVCPTPAPDHAQARQWAERFVSVNGMVPPPNIDTVANLARAYLALAASPQEGRETELFPEPEFKVAGTIPASLRPAELPDLTPPVAPLPPVVTPPTDDEALDLWRAVKRNHAEEADAVVMFTRLLTAALARQEG